MSQKTTLSIRFNHLNKMEGVFKNLLVILINIMVQNTDETKRMNFIKFHLSCGYTMNTAIDK